MDTIRGVAQGTTAKELLNSADQRQLGVSSLYQTSVDDYTVERLISDWREKGKSSSMISASESCTCSQALCQCGFPTLLFYKDMNRKSYFFHQRTSHPNTTNPNLYYNKQSLHHVLVFICNLQYTNLLQFFMDMGCYQLFFSMLINSVNLISLNL